MTQRLRPEVQNRRQRPPERQHPLSLRILALWLAAGLVYAPASWAGAPSGENVVAGDASVSRGGDTTTVRAGDDSIIEWSSVSVPIDHTLTFIQPSTEATVLNRDLSGSQTLIEGSLHANGNVIIANPYGIYIGGEAVVDVGSLVAAAGSIDNEDFLSGKLLFNDLRGRVENLGEIRASSVSLLGRSVANHGHISAPDGDVLLAAGDSVWLMKHESPVMYRLPVDVAGLGDGGLAEVENTGTIDASRGRARLAAGDLLSLAIKQQGVIRAREIAIDGGSAGLVELSGELDAAEQAPGQQGGTIDVRGEFVHVYDAELDASGTRGGGTIHVGGERRGAGDVRSSTVFIAEDAALRADAEENGDGGEIVVWADDAAWVYGDLSARGGSQSGDGGFVETSAAGWLDVQTLPDLGAIAGDMGQWLIDPTNITVIDRATCTTMMGCELDLAIRNLDDLLLSDRVTTFSVRRDTVRSSLSETFVSAEMIAAALGRGTNIILSTRTLSAANASMDQGNGSGAGNIRFTSGLDFASPLFEDETGALVPVDVLSGTVASLALEAANDIIFEAGADVDASSVAGPGSLALNLFLYSNNLALGFEDVLSPSVNPQAELPGTTPGGIPNENAGTVRIDAPIDTGGGSITVRSVDFEIGGAATVDTGGAFVDVDVIGGNIGFSTSAATAVTTQGGTVSFRAQNSTGSDSVRRGGAVTLNSGISTDGGDITLVSIGSDVQSGTTPAVQITNANLDARASDGSAAGDILIQAAQEAPNSSLVELGGDLRIENAAIDGGAVRILATQPREGTVTPTIALDNVSVTSLDANIEFNNAETPQRIDLTLNDTTLTTDNGIVQIIAENLTATNLTADTTANSDGDDLILIDVSGPIFDPEADPPTTITDVTVGGSLTGTQVRIAVGASNGRADLVIPSDTGLTIAADTVTLRAGDGFTAPLITPEVPAVEPSVISGLADLSVAPIDGSNADRSLFILQDGDLDDADFTAGGIPDYTNVSLAAFDGTVSASNDYAAAESLTIEGRDIVQQGGSPALAPTSLDLRFHESYRHDGSLLLGAVDDLAIRTGLSARAATATTSEVLGDLILDGTTVSAADSLTLQAGVTSGIGDLRFENAPTLAGQTIELRAGNGFGGATAAQVLEPTAGITISFSDPVAQASFTLRQDADVSLPAPDPAVMPVPEASAFAASRLNLGATQALSYTLQSDDGSVFVGDRRVLTTPGNQPLDLTLSASEDDAIDIVVDGGRIATRKLELASASNLQVDAALLLPFIDGTAPTDATVLGPEQLTLRAGAGNLSFAAPALRVAADRVNLVAGAEGGNLNQQIDAFTGTQFSNADGSDAPDTFIFQHNSNITIDDLAPLRFEGNASPDVFGIRSNLGEIALRTVEFDLGGGPSATIIAGRTVLAAPTVSLRSVRSDRTIGTTANVDLLTSAATAPQIDLRGNVINFEATGSANNCLSAGGCVEILLDADQISVANFDVAEEVLATEANPFVDPSTLSDLSREAIERITFFQDKALDTAIVPLLTRTLADPASVEDISVELISTREGITVSDPTNFSGADLSLLLTQTGGIVTAPEVLDGRTISFSAPGAMLNVDQLTISSDTGLTLDNVTIDAMDTVAISAGVASQGDLRFGSMFTLAATDGLALNAGGSAAAAVAATNAANLLPGETAAQDQEQQETLAELDSEIITGGASFTIRDSDPADTALPLFAFAQDSSIASNVLPAADQLASEPVNYSVTSTLGTITVADVDALVQMGGQLTLQAPFSAAPIGRDEPIGQIILQQDGAIDLTPLVSSVFSTNLLRVESTGGDVDLSNPMVDLLVSELRIAQNADFVSSTLPALAQYGGNRITLELEELGVAANERFDFDSSFLANVAGNDLRLISNQATNTSAERIPAPLRIATNLEGDFAVSSLTAMGSDVTLASDRIETASFQRYEGSTLLAAPSGTLSLEASSLSFIGKLDDGGAGMAASALEVASNGLVNFSGDIGSSAPIAALTVDLDGTTEASRVDFSTRDEDDDSFATNRSVNVLGTLSIAGVTREANADGTERVIAGRTSVPTIGTVTHDGALSLTADVITLGPRDNGTALNSRSAEKLSVAGNLEIDAATRVRVGDISALAIDIDAPQIQIVRREGGQVLGARGSIDGDATTDWVANRFTLSVRPDQVGKGRDAAIGIQNGNALRTGGLSQTLATFPVANARPNGQAITRDDLIDASGRILDLRPLGAPFADLTDAIVDRFPLPEAHRAPVAVAAPNPALGIVGIEARAPSAAERASLISGAPIYDDSARVWGSGAATSVVALRLDDEAASAAATLFRQVFGSDGERREQLRSVLATAINEYREGTGARRILGFELRRWLRNRPNSQASAYQVLNDLEALFAAHRRAGLAPGEYEPIQRRWVESIAPEAISSDELAQAIHPTRYVRGSDILDIFGK